MRTGRGRTGGRKGGREGEGRAVEARGAVGEWVAENVRQTDDRHRQGVWLMSRGESSGGLARREGGESGRGGRRKHAVARDIGRVGRGREETPTLNAKRNLGDPVWFEDKFSLTSALRLSCTYSSSD